MIEKNVKLAQTQARYRNVVQRISTCKEIEERKNHTERMTEEPFDMVLSKHREDPVISFNSAKKPGPKKENLTDKKPMKEVIPQKDEYIDERGNSVKVEGNERTTYCSKFNKYCC